MSKIQHRQLGNRHYWVLENLDFRCETAKNNDGSDKTLVITDKNNSRTIKSFNDEDIDSLYYLLYAMISGKI